MLSELLKEGARSKLELVPESPTGSLGHWEMALLCLGQDLT